MRSLSFLAILTTASLAGAQSVSDIAASQALFDQAKELSKQGKWAEACAKYEDSQRLSPTLNTQYYLADCEEHIGKTASAWANFVAVADKAKAAHEDAKESHSRKRASALEARLCRLEVRVLSPAAGESVKRNGNEVSKAMWGAPFPIDPGTYNFEASAPGLVPISKSITLVAGTCDAKSETIEIPKLESAPAPPPEPVVPVTSTPTSPPPTSPPPKSSSQAPPPSDVGRGRAQRTIGLVVAGLGAIGVGVGLVVRSSGRAQFDAAVARCTQPGPNPCSDADADDAVAGRDKKNLGWIVAGTGGALLAGGVVLFLTAPSGTRGADPRVAPEAQVSPWVGGGVSGVRFLARF